MRFSADLTFKIRNMKNINLNKLLFSALAIFMFSLSACKDDDDVDDVVIVVKDYTAIINLTQYVNDSVLQMNTSGFPYENAMMQKFKVTKLQYLISDLTFTKDDGTKIVDNGYHYVTLSDSASLTYTLSSKIPAGSYSSVGFTFGFDEEDNITGEYADLNTLGWNWPSMGMFGNLGGGYHFMRLEGDYLDSNNTSAEFKIHMGTARNDNNNPVTFEANHFDVILANSAISVANDFNFDIEMNIEEWLQNPTTWDFNVWNAPTMPIYNAQKALNLNGSSVFSFKK